MKYFLIGIICFVLTGTAWGMSDYIVPKTWRYEITVEIKTPKGIKSGSAVREVRARKNAANIINRDAPSIEYEVTGEAVVINLGEYGVLFSLVGSHDQVQKAFFKDTFLTEEKIKKAATLKVGSKAELRENQKFVIFEDTNDPQSIRSFDLTKDTNNKLKLKIISIEITDKPVTFGNVRKALPWIDTQPMGLGFAKPSEKDPAKYLTKSSFIKGGQ